MPYILRELPTFPIRYDMWDLLKNEKRPIMVYGMGNGADKLFERFNSLGIKVCEIFASDGFVRGHSFRGYQVKSFSDIKEKYSDFVIVLSFASNREEVLSMLADMDARYDMYVPDMPIANTDEYFDKDFYNANYESIIKAYESLADENSRAVFSSVINYRLTGKMKFLLETYTDRDEMYALMPRENIMVSVDAGAYNGDTAREMKEYFSSIERIYALEPDKKNFKKLLKYSEAETEIEVKAINAAAWSTDSEGSFFGSGNRNSTVVATASFEHKEEAVKMLKIDNLTEEKFDYIKYDVEGAEKEALVGSHSVICRDNPTMLISLYHRSRDLFDLINMISESYPFYKLHLCRLKCLPAWEINLIAVKNLRKEN